MQSHGVHLVSRVNLSDLESGISCLCCCLSTNCRSNQSMESNENGLSNGVIADSCIDVMRHSTRDESRQRPDECTDNWVFCFSGASIITSPLVHSNGRDSPSGVNAVTGILNVSHGDNDATFACELHHKQFGFDIPSMMTSVCCMVLRVVWDADQSSASLERVVMDTLCDMPLSVQDMCSIASANT